MSVLRNTGVIGGLSGRSRLGLFCAFLNSGIGVRFRRLVSLGATRPAVLIENVVAFCVAFRQNYVVIVEHSGAVIQFVHAMYPPDRPSGRRGLFSGTRLPPPCRFVGLSLITAQCSSVQGHRLLSVRLLPQSLNAQQDQIRGDVHIGVTQVPE